MKGLQNKVCAVVVTYNIGKRFIENFNDLYNQVNKVIIVDNGSDIETTEVLRELQEKYENVEVIYNNRNLGLGKAQNIGIKKAMEENFDWILLLDHDSKVPPDMVKRMLEHYNKLPENEKKQIGMIAPNIYDINLEDYMWHIVWEDKYFKRVKCNSTSHVIKNVVSIIASGSLIKTEVFKKIGLMREDYFIDQIDIEFAFRLLDNGFKNIVLCSVVLYHTIGNRKQGIKVFGWDLTPMNYSPVRYYYIFRNKILLIRDCELFKKEKIMYLPFIFIVLSGRVLGVLFYEKNKIKKLYFILRGICDGLRGKRGKLNIKFQ